jgi:L-asparaginase
MNNSTSILVIYTGGTIGMVIDPATGALHPVRYEELDEHVPMLKKFNFRIEFHSFDPLIDSSDISPRHWTELVSVIEANYERFDGFVILHGSDTMAYTASALSFMLENLNKPVILTGSQLPLGMIRTDGRENFLTAIEIAAAKEEDTPMVPEVAIYFENILYRGNRTFKYNAENFNAFHSGNYPPLAEVGVHIRFNAGNILRPNFKKLKAYKDLDDNIAILKLFPGISRKTVAQVLGTEGLKGVVMETFGSGNATSEAWFLEELRRAIDHGILIMNVTQCKSGSVEMGKYQTSIELEKIGVIGGADITTESAVTKMMFLFGHYKERQAVRDLLQRPLRGEMTTGR